MDKSMDHPLIKIFQQLLPPRVVHRIEQISASDRPVVAVIMSAFNHWEYTQQALKSYYLSLDDRYHYIMVLIDDASSDKIPQQIENEIKSYDNMVYLRFKDNGGLTQTWNFGINFAIKRFKADYIVLANNDILIPRGAIGLLVDGLTSTFEPAIIGPLTNCPGFHRETQDIRIYLPGYVPSTNLKDIERTLAQIRTLPVREVHEINGFVWAGTRSAFLRNTFWNSVYSFNPLNRNTENEMEFQKRSRDKGIKTFLGCNCFIFHYKDVTFNRVGQKIINADWIFRP